MQIVISLYGDVFVTMADLKHFDKIQVVVYFLSDVGIRCVINTRRKGEWFK